MVLHSTVSVKRLPMVNSEHSLNYRIAELSDFNIMNNANNCQDPRVVHADDVPWYKQRQRYSNK